MMNTKSASGILVLHSSFITYHSSLPSQWHFLERVMGIEPTRPAWKAGTLPLSYTRVILRRDGLRRKYRRPWSGRRDLNSRHPPWQGGTLPLSYYRVRPVSYYSISPRPFQVHLAKKVQKVKLKHLPGEGQAVAASGIYPLLKFTN